MSENSDQTDRQISDYWVLDSDIIKRIRLPEKIVRAALHRVDANPTMYGFPPKVALWGDRRYWPAVKAWFDREYGIKMDAPRIRIRSVP